MVFAVRARLLFSERSLWDDSGKNMGKLIDDPVLAEIGEKHGKSGAQVALAWGIAHGKSVIPKSKTPARIKANLEGGFKLEAADLEKIAGVDKKLRFNDPSGSFQWYVLVFGALVICTRMLTDGIGTFMPIWMVRNKSYKSLSGGKLVCSMSGICM